MFLQKKKIYVYILHNYLCNIVTLSFKILLRIDNHFFCELDYSELFVYVKKKIITCGKTKKLYIKTVKIPTKSVYI